MEHRVSSVMKNSIGEELGIRPGDVLLSVDGAPVEDVLDYREKTTRPYFELLMKSGDEEILFEVERAEDCLLYTSRCV